MDIVIAALAFIFSLLLTIACLDWRYYC